MTIDEARSATAALAADMEAQGDQIGADHLTKRLAGIEQELLTLGRDSRGTLIARIAKRQARV